jgi:hypothetical protein
MIFKAKELEKIVLQELIELKTRVAYNDQVIDAENQSSVVFHENGFKTVGL